MSRSLLLAVLLTVLAPSTAFLTLPQHSTHSQSTRLFQSGNNSNEEQNVVTKASWYAAEAFGKLFAGKKKSDDAKDAGADSALDLSKPPSSTQETKQRLKLDNEREYFLSGQVDTLIYDPDCEFADPFVSFNGRDRFVENLANLGSFIINYSAKPLVLEEGEYSLTTKFLVKLELNLPWKPVLAWPWGVLCEIDPETNLVTLHKESWDIEAWEGVKQVFRKPTTKVIS